MCWNLPNAVCCLPNLCAKKSFSSSLREKAARVCWWNRPLLNDFSSIWFAEKLYRIHRRRWSKVQLRRIIELFLGRSRWLVRQFSTIVVGVVLTFAANIVDNDVTIIFAIVDDDVTGIFAFVFIGKPLVFAVL